MYPVGCPYQDHSIGGEAVGLGRVQPSCRSSEACGGCGDTGQAVWMPSNQPTSATPAPRPSSHSQAQGCSGPCRTSRRTSPSQSGTSMSMCRMTGSSRSMSFPSEGRRMLRRGTCPVSWGDMDGGRPSPIRAMPGMWGGHQAWLDQAPAPPKLPLTLIRPDFSLTGQEGAAAHTHFEAKAGLSALQGKCGRAKCLAASGCPQALVGHL